MNSTHTHPPSWRKPSLDELGPDLLVVSPLERIGCLLLPFLLTAGFFVAGARGWWIPALLCVMAQSFFTYGSVSHDLVHRTLRLPRWLNEFLLFTMEAISLRSGHAYRASHLHHHARFPADDDIEARTVGMGIFRALLDGVVTQPRLWLWALRRSSGALRRCILVEGVLVLALLAGSVAAWPWTPLPALYCALTIAGSWLFPLITVVIPHSRQGADVLSQTRLFRGKVLSLLAFEHLYHLEHHLFPQVPHQRWPELARRLDPYFTAAGRAGHPLVAMTQPDREPSFVSALIGDGRSLIFLTALALALSGAFACFLAATGSFLPHDVNFLGMQPQDLCGLHQCRIVHFMFHDRVAFGGVLLSIATLYSWLALFPLRRGEPWAWWILLVTALTGFASFLAYLSYGYLDTWHGWATVALLPVNAGGLWFTRRLCLPARHWREILAPGWRPARWRSRDGLGRFLLLATGAGMTLAGLTILTVGMTFVFVPQDLTFLGVTIPELNAINPRLIPLIAHDRAGFGGGLITTGLLVFGVVWKGNPKPHLWQAILLAGTCGFAAAIGVHYPIGYVDPVHLAPAWFGGTAFLLGITLSYPRYSE